MSVTVIDARPPAALLAVLNPVMRMVLRTRLGALVPPVALLEFRGRRTGRLYRVPVGWHLLDDHPVVLTPAPWSRNFVGGAAVTVHHAGRAWHATGRVADTPDMASAGAAALRSLLASGTPARMVGLRMRGDGSPTTAELMAAGRVLITLE